MCQTAQQVKCLDPHCHLLKRLRFVSKVALGQILQTQESKRLEVDSIEEARMQRILCQPKRRKINMMREDQFQAVVPVIGKRLQGLETALQRLAQQQCLLVLEILRLPHPALLQQNLRKSYLAPKVDHDQDLKGECLKQIEADRHLDHKVEQTLGENVSGIRRLLAVVITGQN